MITPINGAIHTVHIVFKTHLDLGFTDLASTVTDEYLEHYIPKAIRVSEILAQSDREEQFAWTTGSWLIQQYLRQAQSLERERLERAIHAGQIHWNAMPFTAHAELMDPSLFRHGLSISKRLDQRFGRSTIAAKITDIPGLTRGVVPLLSEIGVRFLHIGANSACAMPDVPPVFVWRDPSGAELIVVYHDYYGGMVVVDGFDEALALEFTRDNLGPHNIEEVILTYRRLRQQFPNAKLIASSLDAFALSLEDHKSKLPIITGEIGDTWIHGAASDPWKLARYRELCRLRTRWLEGGHATAEQLEGFSDALLLVPEHTWGLDEKSHLGDTVHFEQESFQAVKSQANFQAYQASWDEQRGYIRQAVDALEDDHLRAEAEHHLVGLDIAPTNLEGFQELPDLYAMLETSHFVLGFAENGSINHLFDTTAQRLWADQAHRLGAFQFEIFSHESYEQFFKEYVPERFHGEWWLEGDFGKPGLKHLEITPQHWRPTLKRLFRREDDTGTRLLAELEMPREPHLNYGCPERLTLEVFLPNEQPILHLDLSWFGKPASRIPQASWCSFAPITHDPSGWRLDKLGEWVSPLEVLPGGNRTLHAVNSGVRNDSNDESLLLESLDAPLVAPGKPALLRFDNGLPDLEGGMHFNLHNNVWGTNFRAWFEGDMRFRFVLRAGLASPVSP